MISIGGVAVQGKALRPGEGVRMAGQDAQKERHRCKHRRDNRVCGEAVGLWKRSRSDQGSGLKDINQAGGQPIFGQS